MSSSDQSSKKNQGGRRRANKGKVEKESNRQVTFSKRRASVFKKASELCTVSGAEAAVLVFSPGDKAHTYGNPDFNTVADKFLNGESSQVGNDTPDSQADLEHLAHLERLIEVEKARAEELKRARKTGQGGLWVPPEQLNYEQLVQLKSAVIDFGKKFEAHVKKAMKNPVAQQNSCSPSAAADVEANSSADGTMVPDDQGATRADKAENMPRGSGNGNDGHGSI